MGEAKTAGGRMHVRRKTKLLTTAFAMVVALAFCFIFRNRFETRSHSQASNWEYMTRNVETCAAGNDLVSMKSFPQLILFIDNVNAVQAVQSRVVMRELVESIRLKRQTETIVFRRVVIDSGGSGELVDAIVNWLSDQDADLGVVISGCGGILWVRDGTVVDSVNYAHDAGIASVLSHTDRAFPAIAEVN